MRIQFIASAALLALGLTVGTAASAQGGGGAGAGTGPATERTRTETRAQESQRLQERERIYGRDLMTDEEAALYRARLQQAHTEQEREAIRREHHAEMQKRAAQRGVRLPDEPMPGHGPGVGAPGAPGGRGPGAGGTGGAGGRGPGPR